MTATLLRCRVKDPIINADYGVYEVPSRQAALDLIARKMGWESYDDFTQAATRHSGDRRLVAAIED